MENNNLNELIEQGKQQLSTLRAEAEKLAGTAGQIAGVKAEELSKKADELLGEAKTQVEAKTKEIRESEDYKIFEAEGKKAIDDLAAQMDTLAKDVNAKFKNLFGSK